MSDRFLNQDQIANVETHGDPLTGEELEEHTRVQSNSLCGVVNESASTRRKRDVGVDNAVTNFGFGMNW